ncbi:hypothetical protein CY35_14G022100 [Sphagnum magellanicum]|nr:hypothetical protein CY35_14G022100 [Sphagnum magellanicum]
MGKERNEERRCYWVKTEEETGSQGIVAGIGWMFSKQRHLLAYSRLYAASGWDSLVCHPHVLNLWFPSRATVMALEVLEELAKEVVERPRPIVFATFSGGTKACLYKVFQILHGSCTGLENLKEKFQAVRACVTGQIYDSSPADFVSEIGVKFLSSPVVWKSQKPSIVISLGTKTAASILDPLFSSQFEQQRVEYWLALEQSVDMGPILILCSTNDELAPINTIQNFAKSARERGCQVTLVVWDTSEHVGHFRKFPDDYGKAVSSFLINAASSFALRQRSPYSNFKTKTTGETITANPTNGVFTFAVNTNQQLDVQVHRTPTMYSYERDHRGYSTMISSTSCAPDIRFGVQQLEWERSKMDTAHTLYSKPITQSKL